MNGITIGVAEPSCSTHPKKGGAPRTSKRKHQYLGKGCVNCGVRKNWPGAKGPCPPKVRT